MASRPEDQKWLDLAILDLQESKQAGAAAWEEARLFLEEKTLLKEKLKVQLDFWNLEKQRLEEDLVQTKKEQEGKSLAQAYEIAALHVSLGSQQQETLCFKLRLEGAVDEVELLSSRLLVLNVQLQEREAQSCDAHNRHLQREASLKQRLDLEKPADITCKESSRVVSELKKKHEIEVEKLKYEQNALSVQRKQEVSALLREKDFVWDQLKRMEGDYSNRLGIKKQELKNAEETLQQLQQRVGELQRAHDEKTVEATVLRINVQAAEEEVLKLKDDLSQLKNSGQRQTSNNPEVNNMMQDASGLPMSLELLAQKEEELKRAKKLMDELRLENQNLRLLYADLEGQLKEKQKPEKTNREPSKDAATRNLTADLEAAAVTGTQASVKACAELKRRRLLDPESCAEGASHRSEQPTPIQDGSRSRQIVDDSKLEQSSSARLRKNKLFSSVFGIPKVLAGT